MNQLRTEHGQLYFYNFNTGKTTWEPPQEPQGKRVVSSSMVNQNVVDRRRTVVTAEEWLANNDEDTIGVGQRGGRRRGSGQTDFSAQASETCARRASGVSLASRDPQAEVQGALQDSGAIRHELPSGSARLRGKAAAVWAAMEAKQKEKEEMTGTPEITRLGRSKHRSVDDLFLFQRNVEASRRHKQDERDTQEERLVTGRPETCSRSALLVERMRRDNNSARRSTSQRLHEKAGEQRRRQENLQARVRTAIRRRATPNLSTRSRSLPSRGRRDVADRLYEQALVSREEALERECLALNPPRGATFRPEIVRRSGVLAQRRRERWVSIGLDVSSKSGGSVVHEVLLAEGTLYHRRRQERRARQEQLAQRRQSPTINRHSRRLLRDAERMGKSIGIHSDSGKGNRLLASQAEEEICATPRFEALSASKRLLESRYGRDSIPSMEQRAKEREMERRERQALQESAERDKENRNDVARRVVRTSSRSESPGHRHRPETAVASGGGKDIYQRTTEYVRRRESRRASEREALLAEELAGCTFAPKLPARRRGSVIRQTTGTGTGRPCSDLRTFDTAGGLQVADKEDRRVLDSVGYSGRSKQPSRGAGHRQRTVVSDGGWLSSATAEVGEEEDERGLHAGVEDDESDLSSIGSREAGCSGDSGAGTMTTVSRGGVAAVGGSSLPKGWTAFTSPEGWEYFFNNETRVVQWQRPTR
eukprot:g7480.t1